MYRSNRTIDGRDAPRPMGMAAVQAKGGKRGTGKGKQRNREKENTTRRHPKFSEQGHRHGQYTLT
jgi:hypothetical protein